MVLFLTNLQLWLIVGISTMVIIFCLLVALYFCTSWLLAKKKNSRFYNFENTPARKSSIFEIINSYRNYYSSYEIAQNKLLNDTQQSSGADSDRNLMDSTDFSKGFSNCLLRINSTEDRCSRASTGSLRTYYSVNLSRSNSKCSFVSCSEGSDIGEIV